MTAARAPVVARITRGAFLESEHHGSIAVGEGDRRLLLQLGDVSSPVALRSAAKPFQLIPLLESGAAKAFGLTPQEIAVAAGSHAGRPEHIQAVTSLLAKAGLDESHLRCGAHAPFDGEAADHLAAAGAPPTPLHNNCSGKHAAMLATAKHLGAPLDSYLSPGHAVQKLIKAALAWAAGVDESSVGVATDGCSAPTFFLPLASAAAAFARLAAARGADSKSAALGAIRDAMTAHPALVSGPGRFDTSAMTGMPGLCAKGGAEGFQGLALRREDGRTIGVAVKIWDGAGRASGPVALEALRQAAGALPGALEALRAPSLMNHRGADVGRIEAAFALA